MQLTLEDIGGFLKKVPLFRGLSDSHLKRIARRVREREFTEGDAVLKQGELGIGLFVIVDGDAKVIRKLDDGTERELDTLTNTDFFGELSLLDDASRVASIVAVTKLRCLALTKLDFLEELDREPQMAVTMLREMAMRFRRIVSSM